jgi:uncharacterized protein VirK/YbjX
VKGVANSDSDGYKRSKRSEYQCRYELVQGASEHIKKDVIILD